MVCPICGRYYCDHTAAERHQTDDHVTADALGMSVDEYRQRKNAQEKKA
jgi:hypothetical protein